MRLADISDSAPVEIDVAGTLPEWSAAANRLFATGCEAQGFALLASFAAPLMSLFRTDEGGAVVSIYGGKKSGKTVAYEAAGSVWGSTEALSLAPYAGATRYVKIAQLCNLPVLDDSLGGRDPDIVRVFLFNFVRRMKGLEWQSLLISFSPVPVFCNSIIQRPGVEIDVSVPAALQVRHPSGRDPMVYDLHNNRGHAGHQFLCWLAQEPNQKWARKALAAQIAEMTETVGVEVNTCRYAMRAIAACHVAGQIAVSLGILEFEPDRITRWVRERALPQVQPAG